MAEKGIMSKTTRRQTAKSGGAKGPIRAHARKPVDLIRPEDMLTAVRDNRHVGAAREARARAAELVAELKLVELRKEQVRTFRETMALVAHKHPVVTELKEGSLARIVADAFLRAFMVSPIGTGQAPKQFAADRAHQALTNAESTRTSAIKLGERAATKALDETFTLVHNTYAEAAQQTAQLAVAS